MLKKVYSCLLIRVNTYQDRQESQVYSLPVY